MSTKSIPMHNCTEDIVQPNGTSCKVDYAPANTRHFNQLAHQYDNHPLAVELARRAAEGMRKAYSFNEDSTTIMEFACGTGLVSRELAAYAKSIVGVDISQGMVDQFNGRVKNQGISPDEMRAVCVELKGEEGELENMKFDVIVCASSYHHFTSINEVTRILAFFLKPGGALLVVDLLKNDGEHPIFPEHSHHIVAHRAGFEEDEIRRAFEGAGLISFNMEVVMDAIKGGHEVRLFIAKGMKP